MKRILPTAAWFLASAGLVAGSALRQVPAGSPAPPAPGTPPSGSLQTGTPAYPPPPTAAPPGTHYEWVYSYDRHGDYLGHWVAVRNR
jgi:hypothetical protein